MEYLEKREVLNATAPTVVSVTPAYGTVVNETIGQTQPTLSVHYSEGMNANTAQNPANYLLFDSTGKAIVVNQVAYDSLSHTTTLLKINNGAPLVSGTYTLLLRGDQITADATNNFLPLTGPGELAVANFGTNNVSLLQDNGSGTFTNLGNKAVGTSPSAVTTGDLNGDKVPDVVVANQASNSISVLIANGNGTYAAPVNLSLPGTSNGPVAVAIGDLTGNGTQDIVVANAGSNDLTIFWNDGNGNFSTSNTTTLSLGTGENPTSLALGDFNNDGLQDIAVGHNGAAANLRGVMVLLNLGNQNFATPVDYAQGTFVTAVATADFNRDGNADLAITNDQPSGSVVVLQGNGVGAFGLAVSYSTVENPDALAVGDMNRDGYQDIVVGGAPPAGTISSNGNLGVLFNTAGTSFAPSFNTTVNKVGTALRSVVITDLNGDAFPDIAVTVQSQTNPVTGQPITPPDNVYTLTGNGAGLFTQTGAYLVGGTNPTPSSGALISDPLVTATTFTIISQSVQSDLLRNGTFEKTDLTGEQNLTGWTTFNMLNSHGAFSTMAPPINPLQPGPQSPISLTPFFLPPQGQRAAVLDEADNPVVDQPFPGTPDDLNEDTAPYGLNTPLSPLDYQGTHILYQNLVIPASTSALQFSMQLGWAAQNAFTSPTANSSLSYLTSAANQQIRVDIVDASNPISTVDAPPLVTLFQTNSSSPTQTSYFNITHTFTAGELAALEGKTVRLRITVVTNQGKIVVGADDVHLTASYTDTLPPRITNLGLRDPGYGTSGGSLGTTNDITLVGQVTDDGLNPGIGSPNNIAFIAIDLTGQNNFTGPNVIRITSAEWDANGNFSVDLSKQVPGGLIPGAHTISIQAVDNAGNVFNTTASFIVQGPSLTNWQDVGGGSISTAGTPGAEYATVSGQITAIATNPNDPTGNSYFVGTANGGIWSTTDGGNDWTPLTDYVFDSAGNPVPESIGGLAVSSNNGSLVIYAGTGVASGEADARPGFGILKSVDGGKTWQVLGESVFNGAHVSKVVVDPTNANRVYVAVAWGGQGPGLYGSSDGGNTWKNLLNPAANMLAQTGGSVALPPGTPLTSVTDVMLNPFSPEDLVVGMGNIGQVAGSLAGGVWQTGDFGVTWHQVIGGLTPGIPLDTIPTGTAVGRVTLAQGTGTTADTATWYVMMATPASTATVGTVPNASQFLGLFKTLDNGNDWTQVRIRYDGPNPKHNYLDLNPLGQEGADTGSLVVDPTDPYIVYLGGSNRFRETTNPVDGRPVNNEDAGFIRVDTTDMISTELLPGLNNGDDYYEYLESLPKNVFPQNGDTYEIVGVYWTDIQTNIPGGEQDFGPNMVPPGIHALRFDAQGRLLIGTDGGIFRATSAGFFPASGPDDPYFAATSPPFDLEVDGRQQPGILTYTDLNGNLKIGNLTAVAMQPGNPNNIFTSQFDTGTSQVLGGTATTMLATSLGYPVGGAGDAFIPNASGVRVVPGATPASAPTVLVSWQFADRTAGLVVDSSSSGGVPGTFIDASAGIRVSSDNAAELPPLAVNPSDPAGELMYGTSNLYETDTAGGTWDLVTPQGLPAGAVITSEAFGQAGTDVFYVGTNTGQVFVTQFNGTDGFPNRSTGLPGAPILALAVDPGNSLVAYAMVGGSGIAHVWKTTNGGQTWVAASNGLPDQPATSMAIVPQSVPGSPQGRLYVGTNVGVYFSNNGGQSWVALPNGMPHVPVVDLQWDPSTNTLLAATQGRGVFRLSTSVGGPFVTGINPATPSNVPLSQVTVNFDHPVDPASLLTSEETNARAATVLTPLVHSTEYYTKLVNADYLRFLRRPADANAQGFVNALQNGTLNDEGVIANLVSSQEYFNLAQTNFHTGDANRNFVDQLFQDLLGRAFNPAKGDYDWVTGNPGLDNGNLTRQQVAGGILGSAEYQTDLVASFYQNFLGRAPLASETSTWVTAMQNGATDEQVITGILSSLEYYQNTGIHRTLPNGGQPSAVALTDLSGATDSNGNPIPDLILADPVTNRLLIFQGLASGGFSTTPITLALPTGANPSAIVATDLDGDHRPDLVVADKGSNQVSVFLNKSSGGTISFAARTDYSAGKSPDSLLVAPLDSSGNLDIAVTDAAVDNLGNYDVSILRGNGNGTFSNVPVSFSIGKLAVPSGIAAGDLNGDGLNDLAVSSSTGLAVYYNQTTTPGAYNFSLPNILTSLATTSVAIGRIDTDNVNDVAATTAIGGGEVLVFQNSGGGSPTYTEVGPFSAGPNPVGITLADLSGDGLNDILVANAAPNGSLTELRNNTVKAATVNTPDTITFTTPLSYPAANSPVGLALGDINRDGVADAVVADSLSGDYLTYTGSNLGYFNVSTDQNFINQAYLSLLQRPVDSGALSTFVQSLGNAEQVRLLGPQGQTVPLSIAVQNLFTGTNYPYDTQYQMTFAPQWADGAYTLIVGPNTMGVNVLDFVDGGHAQDQNHNLINGEYPADRYVGPLAISTSDSGHFVSGVYHSLLDVRDQKGNVVVPRPADSGGFNGFMGPLVAAQSQGLRNAATGTVTSTEYLNSVVTGYYTKYLGQTPSSTALQAWVTALQNRNTTEENLIAQLVVSSAYDNKAQSDPQNNNTTDPNQKWVQEVFRDILGRAYNPTGGDFNWVNALNSNQFTRLQVATFLLNSTEYRMDLIRQTFEKYLGRVPGAGDYNAWLGVLGQPLSSSQPTPDEQLLIGVLSSQEYFMRAGDPWLTALPNTVTAWLKSLYGNVLGRTQDPALADPAGFTALRNSILSVSQPQRFNVAATIDHSVEYFTKQVSSYFQTYLRRPADAGGLSGYVNALATGRLTDEQVIANLVSSAEYFATQANNQNSTWINDVYSDLLHRSATGDKGATNYLNALNNGTLTRFQVAMALLTSTEYRQKLIDSFYVNFLGFHTNFNTDPTAQSLLSALQGGASDENVIATLLSVTTSTANYFLEPHPYP